MSSQRLIDEPGDWVMNLFPPPSPRVLFWTLCILLAAVFNGRAAPLPDPNTSPIQHVVVVMMENRSFDHLLGWMTNAAGRQAGLTYTNLAGQAFSTFPLAPDYQGCGHFDPNHSYAGGRVEYNNGLCDGWLRATNNDEFAIGYYVAADLPFLSAAATNWTVCSNYFSSIMAETFPNRIYQHAAQTDRLENTLDLCTLPTIWDRLSDAGLSARYYFSDLPMLALWGTKYLPITRTISSFYADCASGSLPNVCFVEPRFLGAAEGLSEDDHPHSDIRAGEAFLNQVYQAITASPNWSNTVMVINFDEWGGFFEHVPPPTAPIPTADQTAGNQDGRLGFRVPCIVISPWARRGYVAPERYEHTSILSLIEWRWNLPALTVRDQTAQNLVQTLDFSQTNYFRPQFAVPPGPFGAPCTNSTWITQSGTNLTVHWLSDSKLESSMVVTGPWNTVTNATAPYTFGPTNSVQFFRVTDKWAALVQKAREFGFPGF
jgi:phospholipase C